LVGHQPAGTVLREQGHNIILSNTLGVEGGGSRCDAFGQFTKTELFRMGGVGGSEGGDRSMPIR
jgi:hypothetical protein